MTNINKQTINRLCFKYRDRILAYPTPDGFRLPIYVDDLLEKDKVNHYLWADYEQHGLGSLPDGWKFIIELYGKDFLIGFYQDRGHTIDEAEKIIRARLSDVLMQNSYASSKQKILETVGTKSLGQSRTNQGKIITAKDMLCYDVFKPFLHAYFQGQATLTKSGYEFFEKLHHMKYLVDYYWFALHKKINRFESREEAKKWIDDEKKKAL